MINLINLLKEIVVKPTNPSVKLKRALVDAMYQECIVSYDGDFDEWDASVQIEFDNQAVSYTYYDVFQDLRKTIGDEEAGEFFMSEAPGLVEKMLEERDLDEIVVKPAKPFVFKKGDRVKEMYGDEQSAIVIDRVEDFAQVKKDPKGVDIGWIYQDEDQVTKPWYFVEYASKAFGWEPEDELELDVDDLQEIVVKPTKAYKFRVGMTVKEKSGDQELCKILDVKPNYRTIVDDPEYRHYGHDLYRSRIQNDTDFAEPFYLVKWLEHNTHAEPSWWPESDLEAVKQNKVNEIIVKPTSSYRFDIGDRIRNKVGGILIVKDRYKNKEEVLKAYPYETAWIESQAQYDKDGNSFWYRLSDKEIENKTASPTLAPEIRLIEKGWVKL